ncbi:MAG: hypothetical protein FJX53_13600, partial [Alphaproteobacteria bacterium]|nr:hypothetical protein [Alphaproteobacteria bacterium]
HRRADPRPHRAGLAAALSRDDRRLRREGAEAVVLACTELPLLLRPEDSAARLLDSTALHVEMALRQALAP